MELVVRKKKKRMELVVRKPEKTTIMGVTLLKSERGVTVTEMNAEAAGYTGGIRVGDVLLSVQGEPCTSPEQTSGVLRAAVGEVRLAPSYRSSSTTTTSSSCSSCSTQC